MADSSTHIDQITSAQAEKETTANEIIDALSPAALFGRHATACESLTWGYYGGRYQKADGSIVEIANDTIELTASATNYLLETDGVVSVVTAAPAGWPAPLAGGARALYAIVCDADGVDPASGYDDLRVPGLGGRSGASASSTLTTKGDLLVHNGTEPIRLPVGANGQQLVADSTQAAGVKWANAPFDVHTFYPGVPTASAYLYRGKLARAVAFAADFAGGQFAATANATASTVFDVQKNGASVGSVTIAAGTTTATFASSGGAAVNFAAGDVFAVIAPATPDATLANPSITFAGTR